MIISHSQDFLNGVCTNIIHMHKNKLVYYGVSIKFIFDMKCSENITTLYHGGISHLTPHNLPCIGPTVFPFVGEMIYFTKVIRLHRRTIYQSLVEQFKEVQNYTMNTYVYELSSLWAGLITVVHAQVNTAL